MINRKIVITGGPSTGKTSIINELMARGYPCLEEVSRQITEEARLTGTEQLFLSDPILFSQKLLRGRIAQFEDASKNGKNMCFLDRGIPDIIAYMDYADSNYDIEFIHACKKYKYDKVFVLAPWEDIFENDHVRYENYDQATQIHECLLKTYRRFNYDLLDVPFGSIDHRVDHIINVLRD